MSVIIEQIKSCAALSSLSVTPFSLSVNISRPPFMNQMKFQSKAQQADRSICFGIQSLKKLKH